MGSLAGNHVIWMRRRNLSESTITTRTNVLGALAGRVGLATATRDDIEALLDGCRNPAYRNLWASHLRSFYAWAVEEEFLDASPMRRIRRAETPQNLPRPIPEPALATVIASADRRGNARMALWLTLGGYAGLRCKEISGLQGRDVSLDIGTLRINHSKGGRSRVVPMHPRIAARIEPFLRDGALWNPTPANVSSAIRQYMQRMGLPYSAHQLRHRFATQIYEATGDINVVKELLGHTSISTTQVYTQVSSAKRTHAVGLIA